MLVGDAATPLLKFISTALNSDFLKKKTMREKKKPFVIHSNYS